LSGDKLPALTLPSSGLPFSRVGTHDSSTSASSGSSNPSSRTSLSSFSQSSVNEAKSPPPSSGASQNRLSSARIDYIGSDSYYQGQSIVGNMNQTQPYMDVHSSHLSSGQSYTSQAATAGPLTHYTPYQQPPLLQPASTYATGSYSQYGYANGVTSQQTTQPPSTTMTSQVSSQLLPLPGQSRPSDFCGVIRSMSEADLV